MKKNYDFKMCNNTAHRTPHPARSLLLCALCFLLFSSMQVPPQIPAGKWALESITVFENDQQLQSFDVDKLNFEIPIEINVNLNEVTFVNKSATNIVAYNTAVNGNLLCFFICAEWSVVDEMLQLKWFIAPKEGEYGGEKTFIVKYSK